MNRFAVAVIPFAAIEENGRDRAGSTGAEIKALGSEVNGEILLEPGDAAGYVRDEGQFVGVINVFEETTNHRGRRTKAVVAKVKGQSGLINLTTAFCEGVIEAEVVREGAHLFH